MGSTKKRSSPRPGVRPPNTRAPNTRTPPKQALSVADQQQLQAAVLSHQQGDYPNAQALYNKLLQKHPTQFDALHLLGVTYLQLGQPQLARPLLEKALAIERSAHVLSHYGMMLAKEGQLEAALASYNEALQLEPDYVDAYSNRAGALHRLHRFEEAIEDYTRVLKKQPHNAALWKDQSQALREIKRLDEASASIQTAQRINPQQAEYKVIAALIFKERECYDEALTMLLEALSLKPDYPEALVHQGIIFAIQEKDEEAMQCYDKALAINPRSGEALNNRSNLLQKLKRYEEAEQGYRQVLEEKSQLSESMQQAMHKVLHNLGMVQHRQEHKDEALETYDRLIALKPDFIEAHTSRGDLLASMERLDEALLACQTAVQLDPECAESYFYLGNILQRMDRHWDAVASYRKALSLKEDYIDVWNNQGNALLDLGEFDLAYQSYNRTREIDPDHVHANYNCGLILLMKGQWEEGWKQYAWRWKIENVHKMLGERNFIRDPWDGKIDLRGRIIILHAEQGLGDTLQFSRYAKWVKAQGAYVIMVVQKELLGILEQVEGVDRLITSGVMPPHDEHCPLLNLPIAFNSTPHQLPNTAYLRANSNKIEEWHARLEHLPRPRLGLVWAGNPKHPNDRNRSIALPLISQQLPFPFILLRNSLTDDEKIYVKEHPELKEYTEYIHDFSDTAAIITHIDLLITVDTSVAHLAGAMGKPVWVLLPFVPDWRWMLERSDTPWYPTMRLFRQTTLGNWIPTLEHVKTELQQQVEQPISELSHERGLELEAAGDFTAALHVLDHVLLRTPEHEEALSHRLQILFRLKRYTEALATSEPLIRLYPQKASYHAQQALLLEQLKRYTEALIPCQTALKLDPHNSEYHYLAGTLYRAQQQIPEALKHFQEALKQNPDTALIWIALGEISHKQGNLNDAIQQYQRALHLDPKNASAYNKYGNLLFQSKQYSDALTAYTKAIELEPEHSEYMYNLGQARWELKDNPNALAAFSRAVALRPDYLDAWNNCGILLHDMDRYEEAIYCYQKALAIEPDHAVLHVNYAISLHELKRYPEAIEHFQKASEIIPDYPSALYNESITLLLIGQWQEGWKKYTARWQVNALQNNLGSGGNRKNRWDGQSSLVGKTILLHAEQGMGDTIHYVRYVAMVKDLGAEHIILLVHDKLQTLMHSLQGNYQIVISWELSAHEIHFPLMDLPGVFGTSPSTVPWSGPYLHADPKKITDWDQRLATYPQARIGIAWAGSTNHPNNRNRSIPLDLMISYLQMPLILLKEHFNEDDHALIRQEPRLMDVHLDLRDFSDTAGLIMQLDLVITADTAIAHLAGALGKPVWILISHVGDWRWLEDRHDTPWYPSARLFRQASRGDWQEPLKQVQTALEGFISLLPPRKRSTPAVSSAIALPLSSAQFQEQALALEQQKEYRKALAIYQEALTQYPHDISLQKHCAHLLLDSLQQPSTALYHYNRILSSTPNSGHLLDVWEGKATALERMGRISEALAVWRHLNSLSPTDPAMPCNQAMLLERLGQFDKAHQFYQIAQNKEPGHPMASTHLGMLLLRLGHYTEGWKYYEARWKMGAEHLFPAYQFPCPRWKGEPLQGKRLLICPEQGLGDTIHFLCYVPLLKAQGAQLVVWVQEPLFDILRGLKGLDASDHLIKHPHPEGGVIPVCDYYCPTMSLPYAMGGIVSTIPNTSPYLTVSIEKQQQWHERLQAQAKPWLGLAWVAQERPHAISGRTIPLSLLLQYLPVTFHCLHHQLPPSEQTTINSTQQVQFYGEYRNFLETAALISQMALVISIDTSLAHLSAALGRPTWITLTKEADWRWLQGTLQSPWYPSVRLFRQEKSGDWHSVLADLRKALQAEFPQLSTKPIIDTSPTLPELEQAKNHFARHENQLASDLCESILARFPTHSGALQLRGFLLVRSGQFEPARQVLHTFILQSPTADTLCYYGIALEQQEYKLLAKLYYDDALIRDPSHEALSHRARVLFHLKEYPLALLDLEQIIQRFPHVAEHHKNYTLLLFKMGFYPQAIRAGERSLQLRPHHSETINILGQIYSELGEYERALHYYQRAYHIKTDYAEAHFNAGLALLRLGRWAEGWKEYEWRWRVPEIEHLISGFPKSKPPWDGIRPLTGKTIVLHTEQGLGDTIQFARYIPLLSQKAKEVIVVIPEELEKLFAPLSFTNRWLILYKHIPHTSVPTYDEHCSLISLPGLLGTLTNTVPPSQYLSVPASSTAFWQHYLNPLPKPRIGIVWAGNPEHSRDKQRSIPLSLIQEYLPRGLVSLQKNIPTEEYTLFEETNYFYDVSPLLHDLSETAALINCLDLVISVDTSIAHLAASLGKPVWVLLPFVPDWRWMLERSDTPWYSSMTLYRQTHSDDWRSVLSLVREHLNRFMEGQAPLPLSPPPPTAPTPAPTPALANMLSEAFALHQEARYAEASVLYESILAQLPQHIDALHLFGALCLQIDQLDKGCALLEKALQLYSEKAGKQTPPPLNLLSNYGVGLMRSKRLEEALQQFNHILRIKTSAEAYQHQALVLERLDRIEEAIRAYELALELDAGQASLHYARGILLEKKERYDLALHAYEQAIRLEPTGAVYHAKHGWVQDQMKHWHKAIPSYRQALQLDPENHTAGRGLAFLLIRLGQYHEGWAIYENRWQSGLTEFYPALGLNIPRWNGQDELQNKTILLCLEQGLGDMIQMMRYIPMVEQKGAKIVVWIHEPLEKIVKGIQGCIRPIRYVAYPLPAGVSLPPCDYYCPLMSLPFIFKTLPQTVPETIPYLSADPIKTQEWQLRLQDLPSPRIGLMWAGNPDHREDKHRSIELSLVLEHITQPWILLKNTQSTKEQELLKQYPRVRQYTPYIQDFSDTAALMMQLDIIITVDTSVAHLAGALGKPVWILLAYRSDWRWGTDQIQTPWYPQARLFRQQQKGEWIPVLEEVRNKLSLFCATL